MSTPAAGKKHFSISRSRRTIQWLVVLGTLTIGLRHIMPGETSRGGSFDSFCAFGGVESFLSYVTIGEPLKTTNLLNFALLLGTLGVSLVAGRAFCGWFCPLGAVQDFVTGWTRKLLGEQRRIRGKPGKTALPLRLPHAVDRPLRYAKYLVLAAILAASLYAVFPPLRDFCPVRAVFGFNMTALLWASLGTFLAGAVLVERFWCKYFCPLGALLAFFNRIAPLRPILNEDRCNGCGRCDVECSMGLKDVPHNLDDVECTRCLECLQTCARQGSLDLHAG